MQVYNYIQTSYPMKRVMMSPAKSRSELKKVYDEIVNLSKRTPFYKINISQENQEYAFGIKDTALELKAKLYDMQDPTVSNFDSKAVSVSNESVLYAELLNEDVEKLPEEIKIRIDSLATSQENKGKELRTDSRALPTGNYQFECEVMDRTYSLVFNHPEKVSNNVVMQNLVSYLNHSVTGISASVEEAEKDNYSYIKIVANMTGRYGDNHFSFQDIDPGDGGIVEFFGINRISNEAENARFELNDVDKQTMSNAFSLENTLFISLQKAQEEPVTLKITPNGNKVLDAVESVIDTYNKLINLAQERTLIHKDSFNASKLISEMKGLGDYYSNELEACGINQMEDGTLQIEDSLAMQAATDGAMEALFFKENGFIAKLKDKTEAIAINPMEYLEKIVVFYPNTQKSNFPNPYVTSMYSGLFFNSYT